MEENVFKLPDNLEWVSNDNEDCGDCVVFTDFNHDKICINHCEKLRVYGYFKYKDNDIVS